MSEIEELKRELSLARLQVDRYKASRDAARKDCERWHEAYLKLEAQMKAKE